MLINFSNHHSSKWTKEQIINARIKYGEIKDLSFPEINPSASIDKIIPLAREYCKKIVEEAEKDKNNISAIHIMGEHTFVYTIIVLLQKAGLSCIASTTERRVTENGRGQKISEFRYVAFRDYPPFKKLIK